MFLRGIDVNRLPAVPAGVDCDEEAGVSSPNSTVSSISGKRSEREAGGEDLDGERTSSRGVSDEEDGSDTSRKKLRLSKDQSAVLEESFKEHSTLNPVSFITESSAGISFTVSETLFFTFLTRFGFLFRLTEQNLRGKKYH